jgi:hypothetical protein
MALSRPTRVGLLTLLIGVTILIVIAGFWQVISV